MEECSGASKEKVCKSWQKQKINQVENKSALPVQYYELYIVCFEYVYYVWEFTA